jgi:hypothetical protein
MLVELPLVLMQDVQQVGLVPDQGAVRELVSAGLIHLSMIAFMLRHPNSSAYPGGLDHGRACGSR